jgi:hypothetical protein
MKYFLKFSDCYILKDRKPMKVEGRELLGWRRWMQMNERHVAETKINDVRVSTVFLGVDHNFFDDGPPLLFETVIFGGPHDGWQKRSPTWEQAETIHAQACAIAGLERERM